MRTLHLNQKYIDSGINCVVEIIGGCPFNSQWLEVKNEQGFTYYVEAVSLKDIE
jgi:hypothetical protein